jgi:ribosomal protein S18 acetylase RimI-like enzyme
VTRGSREIDMGVGPDEVWEVLVAPGRHDWYYRLTPDGEFTSGSSIRWLDVAGSVAEESEVIDAEAPRLLVMQTRFVFAPNFAAASPHTVTWEVTGAGNESRVQLSWEGEGPAVALMESQGLSQLQGLRLAVDPAARAEVERLPEIGPIEIRDVTPELIPEYQRFFDEYAFKDFPSWQDCYCIETHRKESEAESAERTADDNRRDMTNLIGRGRVTALLAFAGDQPVGWCNYGETTHLAGVMRKLKLEAPDHEGVGSVACFVIAAPYRGHGVASKLLDAAIERLRARGLRAVEAYPSRTGDDTPQGNYRGPLSLYLGAGFEPYRELDRYVVVRKTL